MEEITDAPNWLAWIEKWWICIITFFSLQIKYYRIKQKKKMEESLPTSCFCCIHPLFRHLKFSFHSDDYNLEWVWC